MAANPIYNGTDADAPTQNLDAQEHASVLPRSEEESSQNRGGINQGRQVEHASSLTSNDARETHAAKLMSPSDAADNTAQHNPENKSASETEAETHDNSDVKPTAETEGQTHQSFDNNQYAAVASTDFGQSSDTTTIAAATHSTGDMALSANMTGMGISGGHAGSYTVASGGSTISTGASLGAPMSMGVMPSGMGPPVFSGAPPTFEQAMGMMSQMGLSAQAQASIMNQMSSMMHEMHDAPGSMANMMARDMAGPMMGAMTSSMNMPGMGMSNISGPMTSSGMGLGPMAGPMTMASMNSGPGSMMSAMSNMMSSSYSSSGHDSFSSSGPGSFSSGSSFGTSSAIMSSAYFNPVSVFSPTAIAINPVSIFNTVMSPVTSTLSTTSYNTYTSPVTSTYSTYSAPMTYSTYSTYSTYTAPTSYTSYTNTYYSTSTSYIDSVGTTSTTTTSTATTSTATTSANASPVGTAKTVSMNEGAFSATGQLQMSDADSGDTHTYSVFTNGNYGTLSVGNSGAFTYALNNNLNAVQALGVGQTLIDVMTWRVADQHDGAGSSTLSVTITGMNDAPVATANTINVARGSVTVAGQLNATDVDFGDSMTFTSNNTAAYGSFTVSNGGVYIYALNNNLNAVQALGAGQTLTDTINWVAVDAYGGSVTSALTVVITANPNVAPTMTGLSGDVLTYTEGNAPTVIEQGGNVIVTDIDSANFNGGTLTVSIPNRTHGGGEDSFSIRNQGTGAGQIGSTGAHSGNLTYGGVLIGTYQGGVAGNTPFDPLVITFNSSATATAITALIKNITYEYTWDDPDPSFTARFVLTDGDGGTSLNYDATVNLVAVNDAPSITNLSGDTLNYTRGAAATVIDQGGNTLVSDVDSANFNGGTLTVSVASGGNSSEDVLAVRNQGTGAGQFGVSGSNVTYGGATIGTFTGGTNGANLVVTFNSNVNTNIAGDLIRNVTYQNSNSANPTTGNHAVSFALTDGDGGSHTVNTTVNVINNSDVSTGGSGNDTLVGGYGSDTILGGAGNDVIYADNQTFNASSITSLQVWFDANNVSANGTAFSDGTAVSTWVDGAGTATNATIRAGSPTYNTDSIGGRSAITFDGNDAFAFTRNISGNFSILGVFKTGTTGLSSTNWYSGRGLVDAEMAGATNDFGVSFNSSGRIMAGVGNPDRTITSTETSLNNNAGHIFDMQRNQAGATISLSVDNGTAVTNTATGTQLLTAPSAITIGSIQTNINYFIGDIAEVLVLNSNITAAEKLVVHEYLSYKYGIALSGTTFGFDTLSGGTGADTFVWTNASYSSGDSSARDVITDFNSSSGTFNANEGDKIDISTLFSTSYNVLGLNSFAGLANQIIWAQSGADTIVSLDYGGDNVADWSIKLSNFTASNLQASDFILPNFSPTISNLGGDTLSYSEGAAATVIEQGGNAVVADANGGNFDTGTLTVSFTAGSDSTEDVLAIRNQGTGAGQIGVSGSNVTYAGVTIGSFTGGSSGANLVVTFNSSADATAATALIKNITYQNTDSTAAVGGNRTVRFVLTDGDGGTSSNYDATVAVNVNNSAPTISNLATDTLSYSEGAAATVIEQGGNAAVADVDSNNFDTGTLTVSFAAGSDSAEDVLAIQNQGTSAGQIGVSGSNVTYGGVTIGTFTGGTSGANLVITFNSSANTTAASALIKNITYQNTDNNNPTTGNRTVRFVLTDGDGGTSSSHDATVSVSAVNDAPTISNISDTLNYSEGAAATVIEQGGNAAVADVDSSNFDTGTLTVSFAAGSDSAEDILAIRNQGTGAGQIGVSGSNVTYAGTVIGTFTGGSSGNNLVITFNSSADATAAGALIKNITYQNTDTNNPTTGNRTVRFVLTDGDGGTSSNYDATVAVSGVNDAPTISGISDTLNFVVGDAATVIEQGNDAVIADVDSANFDTGTLTVAFYVNSDSTEDVLGIRNQGTGAGQIGVSGSNVTYGGTTIGSFTGGSSGANLVITFNSSADATAATALMKNITYQNTDTVSPSTEYIREVKFTLLDGDGASTIFNNAYVAVNSAGAPTISNFNAVSDVLNYTEGDGARVLDQGDAAAVADTDSADFNTGVLSAYFVSGGVSGEDVLSVRNQGTGAGQIGVSGSNITYEGVVIGTLGGTNTSRTVTFNSSATATSVGALVRNLTYENTNTDNPTASSRFVRVNVSDGDGKTSVWYSSKVSVSAVNDAPTIANLSSDLLNYNVGSAATIVDQGGNAAVTDVDSSNLDTGILTVSFAAGSDSAEDVLAIRNQGTGAGQIGISGSNVTYAGTVIGTFTGGSSGANLVVTFNSSANATATTALIKNITYQNTDTNNPTTGNRTVRFVLTDGDGGTSSNYDATVAVSRAPTISNLSTDTLNYSEGAAATVIEQGGNAAVADVDSSNFDTGTLTISFAAGSDSTEDVLAIQNQGTGAGQIGVSGSNVTYAGTVIGTFTGGSSGANLVITLNSSTDATAAGALIKNITYQNTDTNNPTTGNRTVRFVLTDGDGGTSSNYDTTVAVSGVNDAPTISNLSTDTLNYSEGAAATVIEQGGNAAVADVDSSNFDTGTLTVSFAAGSDSTEDVLAIQNQGTGAGQIGVSGSNVTYAGTIIGTFTGGSSGANLVITLNSSADATNTSALIKNITYQNTDTDNPTTGNRTVRFVLTDGDGGTSSNYDTTVSVGVVNDPPTISNLSTDTLNYSEGAAATVIEQGGNAAVADVDSSNFDTGTLTISFAAGSDSAEDVLAIQNQGTGAGQIGVSGSNVTYAGTVIGTFTGGSSGANLVITLNSSSDATNTGALIKNITYQNTDTNNPTTGNRTVRFVLTDGDGGTSSNYDTTVAVSGVNDAPTISNLSTDTLNYSEGAAATVIEQGGNAAVADVDSSNFDTGTLTVSFAAGSDSTEDVLAIRNQGTGAGQIGVSGSNVTYAGTVIGTFTGGSSGANLVITLNSSADATNTGALIKNITYQNTDTDNPTTGNRTVRFVLTDGDGGTSSNYDTTVAVSAVNDAPTISNLSGDTLNYSEGAAATVIEQGANAAVADVDSSNFDTGTLTVSFAAGSDSTEDALAIRNQGTGAGQIGVSGSNVTYAGTVIGTFTGGSSGANLVITLNSSADATNTGALIKNITYQNTDATAAVGGNRTVRFVLTDGDGGTSSNYDTTVAVTVVNEVPTMSNLSGDTLNYTEGDAATVIEQGGNAAVSDVDSSNFDTGTLTVSFAAGSDSAEDVLAIRNQGTGAGQIGVSGSNVTYAGTIIGTFTGGSSGANLVITLNSSSDATNTGALIKNITYRNTDTDNPTTGNRTVRFALTDGDGGTSSNHDTTVAVSAVNDAPTVANAIPDQTITGGEEASFQFAANTFNDVDSSTLTYTATDGSDAALNASIIFTASTRTFLFDPDSAILGTYAVKVTANDGSGGTVTDTFNFTINTPSGTNGGDTADTYSGTNGGNTYHGLGGDDTISGLGGADTLYGGTGNDTIKGGNANDTIYGGFGDDTLYMGDGAGAGSTNSAEVMYGGSGNDNLYVDVGDAGTDTLHGGSGNDTIYAAASGAADTAYGGAGDDLLMATYNNNSDITFWGSTGGDAPGTGNDGIKLTDAGVHGTLWSVTSGTGYTIDTTAKRLTFNSVDANGSIAMNDGTAITFYEVDYIDYT